MKTRVFCRLGEKTKVSGFSVFGKGCNDYKSSREVMEKRESRKS